MSFKRLLLTEYLKIFPDYSKWKEAEYRNIYWNTSMLKNASSDTKKIIDSATVKYSSINRERIINRLLIFNLDTVSTIVSLITIFDNKHNKNVICGFVYSRHYPDSIYKKKTDGMTVHESLNVNNIISYNLNIGPSVESVDGEYRNQFSDFNGIYKIREYFPSIYSDMYKYLTNEIKNRKYKFHRETYYPTHSLKSHELELDQHFRHFHIELMIYMMVWFTGIYRKLTNSREVYLNNRYIEFIDQYVNSDIKYFEGLTKKHGVETIELIYRYFSNICLPGEKSTTILGFGQKIIPLNLLEVQNPFDIRFVPWRDYLVSQALGKLVLNNICPGFPIVNSWIYIKSTNKNIFNNQIQYQRMERSDQAIEILELLVKARSYTQQQKQKSIKDLSEEVTSWMSDNFKLLYDQIDDTINFGKNEIIMSNTSFMIISEYVGRTFHETLKLSKNSQFYNESIGKPFTSGGYKYFKKYIFDLCYNLHCMYEHYGIIHGDLHLNNLTLYQKFPLTEDFKKIEDPHVAYVLGEKNEYCFVLPTLSTHLSIIDFGRCFIHPDKLELLRDKSIPNKYNITGDKEKYHNEQIKRLIFLYTKLVPSARDQESELMVLFTKYFNATYKLMSVSDLFNVMTNLNTAFELNSPEFVSPHSNCIFLVKKIIELCQIYLISNISKLIDNKSYSDTIDDSTSPLMEIILKIFSDNLSSSTINKNIIDVFLFNNPKTHSIDFAKNAPTITSVKKYIDDTGKEIEFSSDGIEFLKKERLEYEETRNKNFDIIDVIAQRHVEKIF